MVRRRGEMGPKHPISPLAADSGAPRPHSGAVRGTYAPSHVGARGRNHLHDDVHLVDVEQTSTSSSSSASSSSSTSTSTSTSTSSSFRNPRRRRAPARARRAGCRPAAALAVPRAMEPARRDRPAPHWWLHACASEGRRLRVARNVRDTRASFDDRPSCAARGALLPPRRPRTYGRRTLHCVSAHGERWAPCSVSRVLAWYRGSARWRPAISRSGARRR